MDPHHPHVILPTNATSAVNPLAATTPTAVARDTVVQTNREGEPVQYTEIIQKNPSTNEHATTTSHKAEHEPKPSAYVLKEADVYKPFAVVSDTTPTNSANNQIVGTTASGSLTTPGKIVGDLEPVLAEHQRAIVAEPVAKSETTTHSKQ